jgi:hypothetical protein
VFLKCNLFSIKRILFYILAIFGLFACDSRSPTAIAVTTFDTTLQLKQVMEWVIDPAADVVWESVSYKFTEKGEIRHFPKNDAEWESVRNALATLIESGNLLKLDGRKRDDGQWRAAASQLSQVSHDAMKAVESRNVDALFAEGGNIYNACKSCHLQYAKHLTNDPGAAKN